MKTDIHPTYHQATITCAGCGTTFTAGSTVPSIRVDICSNCHPFYTGQKKLIDTEGRVERFEKRMAKQATKREPQKLATPTKSPTATKTAPENRDTDRPKTLREMLQEAANRS